MRVKNCCHHCASLRNGTLFADLSDVPIPPEVESASEAASEIPKASEAQPEPSESQGGSKASKIKKSVSGAESEALKAGAGQAEGQTENSAAEAASAAEGAEAAEELEAASSSRSSRKSDEDLELEAMDVEDEEMMMDPSEFEDPGEGKKRCKQIHDN